VPAAATRGPTPPLGMGGDGRVRTHGAGRQPAGRWTGGHLRTGHRTGGHQRAGPRTGGQQMTGPPDTRTTTQVTGHRTGWTPDGWTAGPRTTIPDGWTPDAGHRPATDVMAGVLAVSTRATTPDRWMSAGRSAGRRHLGKQQPRTAQQQGLRGHHAATDRPGDRRPRPSAAGDRPPSSWRRGALLSSDDYGSSVERTAKLHPLWRRVA
jgi:hypothetical protein